MRNLEKFLVNIGLKVYRGFIVENDLDPSELKHSEIKTILLVIRHQMGDMLCSVPMVMSVRSAFPSAKIILVTKQSTRFEEIFKDVKSPVDEVLYYERGIERFIYLLKRLQDDEIDLAIVPSTVVFSGTNHLIAYHSHAKVRAGVRSKDYEKNPVGYLLNIKNDFEWDVKKVHQIERNLTVLKQIKIIPSVTRLNLSLSDESRTYADRFFEINFKDKSKKVIGFHPGAGKETNVWDSTRFADLANMLSKELNAYIFISEGPDDKKFVEQMTKALSEKYGINNHVIHKGRLMDNAAIINKLALFITNDTGIMHIASGLKTPVVALFGETNAFEWGPYGENKFSIQSPNRNINGIKTDTVYNTCIQILNP